VLYESPEGTSENHLKPHHHWVSVVPSGLDHVFKANQDFILGYSRPSLRDLRGVFPRPGKPLIGGSAAISIQSISAGHYSLR
jgi:hypothetical protein